MGRLLKRISPPLLASLAMNALLGAFFTFLLEGEVDYQDNIVLTTRPVIKVYSEERPKLPELRMVGERDGQEAFNMTTGQKSLDDPASEEPEQAGGRMQESTRPAAPELEKDIDGSLPSPQMNPFIGRQNFNQRGLLPSDDGELDFAGLDLQFLPPKGVDESELNSMEKKFYSFRRRTFRAYVMSFLRTYRQVSMEKPLLERQLRAGEFLLTGRVVFSREGEILDVDVIQSVSNHDVNELFERTLQQIGRTPNPPDELVEENDTFIIYYRLGINMPSQR